MKNPYLKTELKYFLYTFKRQPLLIKRAKGSFVWDEKGKKYIDFFSGLAVCGVGHNNKQVVAGVKRQADLLLHSSNYFYTQPQMAAAKALTARWKNSKVFFANSGAEANELAIKLARLWASKTGKKGRDIITFHNAFHGRTLGTLAASRGPKRTINVFEPLPKGFKAVPYNNLEKTAAAINKNTIAILLEPIQGEGGINIASPAFLKGVAALCRKHNLLLLIDEIQSGMGRTGTFFSFEQAGLRPDVVTLAKGLAGGLPLGAALVAPRVARFVEPGLHGSTFGGNPVACAASLEVLKLLTPRALQSIRNTGNYLSEALSRFRHYPTVVATRSRGLMAAIELNVEGASYVSLARQRGLLINCTQGNVLRFLPPYFMTRAELNRCLSVLHSVFRTLEK